MTTEKDRLPEGQRVLFVNWQSPERRMISTVGRILVRPSTPHYEFCYLRGADEAKKAGFAPHLSFPDLREVYRSDDILPFLANRLMPQTRPDYKDYMKTLGLPPDADLVTILVRSGGRRQTDKFELFGMPRYTPVSGILTHLFYARGLRYVEGAEATLSVLRRGDVLRQHAQPDNPHDRYAVQLMTVSGRSLGYLPAYLTREFAELERLDAEPSIAVESVLPSGDPYTRLLCRMVAHRPGDFVPFGAERFQPIVSDVLPQSVELCEVG